MVTVILLVTELDLKHYRSTGANGLRLVAERDLEARCFNLALLPIKSTNDECSTSAIFATNRCYVLGGLSALNLI